MKKTDVLIIGGGLSGLSAANYLEKKQIKVKLLEATDRVGGRVKTDQVNGFLLDRGFQVLLTAYPETQALLDYPSLDLQAFNPGAILLGSWGKSELGDPFRKIRSLVPTVLSPAASISDKWQILALRNRLKRLPIEYLFSQEEVSTLEVLKQYGFSARIIDNFFHPFMSGIFLENNLSTSRRMFDFVFKMFSEGKTTIPARGMEQIPIQLARKLAKDTIILGEKALRIEGQQVSTESGEVYEAKAIVLATEASGLVHNYFSEVKTKAQQVTCVYFYSEESPLRRPMLVLNSNHSRLVNNFCVMSDVSPHYAPEGKSLISVSVNGQVDMEDEALAAKIKNELSNWYGDDVYSWRLLKVYRIDYALPNQEAVLDELPKSKYKLQEGLYICGDHLLNGSINAAMKSGRIVAEVIAGDLG